ncbi:penicillin-insensitive murein endopeptidase [Archangium sp.]|uniref:penicillin-insensitive murein endopeptidase n=1 Tax=Archangium sp. TaxID=1872627 RepID=UPI002D416FA8|nr:penicillin-insensitive murein endopeptidase [Archangium sp.]HYO55285.1 penicillin-insensitive murein endopeptidase [Archangium sp.]
MRSTSWIILWLCAGCTAHVVPTVSPSKVTAQPLEAPAAAPSQPEAVAQVIEHNDAALQASDEALADSADEEAAVEDDEPADAVDTDEGEAQEANASVVPDGPLYTAELSDEQLTEMWKKEPGSLGSISVGFVESGRMVNSVRVPEGGEDWLVVSPELAWGTQETVEYLTRAIREVRAQYPKAPPLRVNQLSSREGGHLRPHKSHQNGRDVDLGFYYPTAEPVRARERERYIDLELNWALIKALAMHTDVQMILVDKRVQKVLYDHALRKGENKEWLDSLFNAGARSLVKHAKRHRDHFHVRFFNPRAQELGRRIAPLLALQPDKNLMSHRVRSGDTLGGIALRYGSSIQGIQKANRMRGVFLRIGQVLAVPLRGPCTRCPIPPPVVVPPRRMPPEVVEQAPAVATKQAPAASEQQASEAAPAIAPPVQPAVVAQETPAASTAQQPSVAAQPEDTGGSAPASADSSTEARPQEPEAPAQEPTRQGSPADSHTSAAIMQMGPSASR